MLMGLVHSGRWRKKIENRVRHWNELAVVSPAKSIVWVIIPTKSGETKLTSRWHTHLKNNKYKDSSANATSHWPLTWTEERLRTLYSSLSFSDNFR